MNTGVIDIIRKDILESYLKVLISKTFYMVLLKFMSEEDNYNGKHIEKGDTEYEEFILGQGLKYKFYVRRFIDLDSSLTYYILGAIDLLNNENDEELVQIITYKDLYADNCESYITEINDIYVEIFYDIYNIDFVKNIKYYEGI